MIRKGLILFLLRGGKGIIPVELLAQLPTSRRLEGWGDFFNDFVIAWNGSKEVLKARLDSELFEEIQTFVNEIVQN